MYLFEYNLTHSCINSTYVIFHSTMIEKLFFCYTVMYLIIRIIGLTGRNQVLQPDLLEKFQQFSLETGILPENIVPLPQNGMLDI